MKGIREERLQRVGRTAKRKTTREGKAECSHLEGLRGEQQRSIEDLIVKTLAEVVALLLLVLLFFYRRWACR